MPNKHKNTIESFLPDFCHARSLFLVVLVAQLLSVIFTLLNLQPKGSLWSLLALYSVSVQIISLFSVSCLCLLRGYLSQLKDWIAGLVSLGIILIVTLIFCIVVIKEYWLVEINFQSSAQSHFIIRNLFVAGLIGSVTLRYFYLLHQYRLQLRLESSARLEALQARIRPHFLFNSMNVIASLTRIDPAKAESAIEDLSDLFRSTLDNQKERIVFAKELANSEKYLAIEKLRLGERLAIEKNISDECYDVLVPPLSVQPLLENAVYHGIQMLPEGGTVTINAKVIDGFFTIEVINPNPSEKRSDGNGIALKNISQRLDVLYSGKASLQRVSNNNEYIITMIIPINN